jgi:hypothetical protein
MRCDHCGTLIILHFWHGAKAFTRACVKQGCRSDARSRANKVIEWRDFRLWQILLQKSFSVDDRKFLGARQRHPQRSVTTTCAPSRATATTIRSTESPLCGKRVSVASRDRDTGVRLSFRRPSRLFPGDRQFRHLARFHRNLLQAIDKPSAGGSRR